jgi:hypothetical protein
MIQQLAGRTDQHQTLTLFGHSGEAAVHLKTISHSEEKFSARSLTVSKLIH